MRRTKPVTPTRHLVGENIRAEMGRRGLSQREVAEWCGHDQPALSLRLRGKIAFDIDELAIIADHLGLPLAALVSEPAWVGLTPLDTRPLTRRKVTDRPNNGEYPGDDLEVLALEIELYANQGHPA